MTKKIEALIKTIYNLENDVYNYNWEQSENCNCGILAKSLTGANSIESIGYRNNPTELPNAFGVPPWTRRSFCMTTNLPLPLVYQSLKDAGFTHNDVKELERLVNVDVLAKMGKMDDFHKGDGHYPFNMNKGKKDYLIQYLKAWVSILQEEETTSQPVQTPAIEAPAEQPKVIEKTVYVSVPTSITEQSKELILS